MTLKYNEEISRKLVHFSSIWIPLLYLYSSESTILGLLPPLAIVTLMLDLSRRYIPVVDKMVNIIFGKMLREKEKAFGLSGATYLLVSSTITILFFSKEIAIFALTILIISDAIAALIGKKFGKHHIFDKSIEGSAAFIISAILIYYGLTIFYHFSLAFWPSLIAILVASLAEALAKKINIDDNFAIPLVIGLMLHAFS